jgi:integrase
MFGDIRPTTAQTYISMLPNFTDQYGDTLLVALSASNLRDWVSQTIVTKGAYTTRFVGVIVKKALKQAVKDGMIAYSPFENVDLPPRKHEQKEATLDTDTVRKAWEASYAHEHGLAVRLGFETGARRGELAALRWSDISAEGSVSISRTVVSLRGGEIAVNEPKTRQSRRKVRVSDSLKDEVNRLRKGKVSTHYIFGGVEPPHPALISRTIQSVLTTIGMGDFSAHDLRHAHATHLLRSRLSPAAVSKRLGHAKTSTTLDIYAHAMEEDEDDIISAVNNVLGPDRTQKSAEQSEETIS